MWRTFLIHSSYAEYAELDGEDGEVRTLTRRSQV